MTPELRRKTILITAGATHEHIDPVRYITNASSGLQGILLAQEALKLKYKVILILGTTHIPVKAHDNLTVINVVSADEMYAAAAENFPKCRVAIFAAAVGDYKVKTIATDKIKRSGDSIILELVPNVDIAKTLGNLKEPDQVVIGFALETSNGLENAKAKITKKNLDYVVLNESTKDNPAFNTPNNTVTFIDDKFFIKSRISGTKQEIAHEILDQLCQLPQKYYVYIVKCADGSLYTGFTTDLERRVGQHNSGKGAKYTRGRTPVELVYSETFHGAGNAKSREYAIKQLTKNEKELLIFRSKQTKK